MKHDYEYQDLVTTALCGVTKSDRTGTGTVSIFGYQMRFDLSKGFPLLTLKRTHWKSVVYELLWMLSGDTNVRWLQENGVTIWDEWADADGDLGPVYGSQWREWVDSDGGVIDQLANLIKDLKSNPDSRRHIISAWNVADIKYMALPPCHCFMQFYVANGKLSCQLYQRSADIFLGVPFNQASYSLLTHIIAKIVGLKVGYFVHTIGDAHIYLNHIDQAEMMLERDPFDSPRLVLSDRVTEATILDGPKSLTLGDFILADYVAHPPIKAPVAV